MWNAVLEEPQAVVFVSDRSGAALRRRERCLKLAGIPHGIEAERRPSGTYYKLIVREQYAVAAHLALQMGGCGRTLKLQEATPTLGATFRDLARSEGCVPLQGAVVRALRVIRIPVGPPP